MIYIYSFIIMVLFIQLVKTRIKCFLFIYNTLMRRSILCPHHPLFVLKKVNWTRSKLFLCISLSFLFSQVTSYSRAFEHKIFLLPYNSNYFYLGAAEKEKRRKFICSQKYTPFQLPIGKKSRWGNHFQESNRFACRLKNQVSRFSPINIPHFGAKRP